MNIVFLKEKTTQNKNWLILLLVKKASALHGFQILLTDAMMQLLKLGVFNF